MTVATQPLYQWALRKAHSPRAPFWVALLFGLELVLFIPLDAVLMFFCLQRRSHTLLYVVIAALFSVVSGVMGYLVGCFLWDLVGSYVVPYLISPSFFAKIASHFQMHESLALFFGALLPFPLKALSLSAGVFKLSLPTFVGYVAAARSVRFLFVGGAMFFGGEPVQRFVERHFSKILLAIGAKATLIFLAIWAMLVAE